MSQIVVVGKISNEEISLLEKQITECDNEILVERLDISPIANNGDRYFLSESSELLLEVNFSEDYELGDEAPKIETYILVARWLRDTHKHIQNPKFLIYKSTDFLFAQFDTRLLPGVLCAWQTETIDISANF